MAGHDPEAQWRLPTTTRTVQSFDQGLSSNVEVAARFRNVRSAVTRLAQLGK